MVLLQVLEHLVRQVRQKLALNEIVGLQKDFSKHRLPHRVIFVVKHVEPLEASVESLHVQHVDIDRMRRYPDLLENLVQRLPFRIHYAIFFHLVLKLA